MPQGATAGGAVAAFDRRVLIVAAALFAVLLALSGRYGFHRDELYFMDAGRHLQGGYVDQPVLAPLLARVSLDLFGVSLPGLRVWAALAAAATVVMGGVTARELGGRRRAQLLAALGTATMPVELAVGHLMGPTVFDVLAWVTLAWLIIRLGRTRNVRLWWVAGLVLGIGLTNKHSIGLFAVAIVIGIVVSGGVRRLLNRWFAIGFLLAAACTVPDLVWQARHGWATVAMTRRLNESNGGFGHVPSWIAGQFLMTTLALVPMVVLGLRRLWRSPEPLERAIVWAFALLYVVFMLTTGAQIYYLAGAYVPLLASGAIAVDERVGAGSMRRLLGWVAVTTAIALPLTLPVLPAADTAWIYPVNQAPGESVGWPELVRTVDKAWTSLPAEQRAAAVIFTADYGEAGAVNELGRALHLPTAVSGQNSEWFWGPGRPDATTVLAIAPGPRDGTGYATYLRRFFDSVEIVATFDNTAGIHNEEWGGHVYLCTGPHARWARLWPALRHYD